LVICCSAGLALRSLQATRLVQPFRHSLGALVLVADDWLRMTHFPSSAVFAHRFELPR
jgi:hypothetical protein